MDPTSSANLLPSLQLNDTCNHVLKDVYSTIAQGKNQMDNEQLNGGHYPYIKIGISDPEQPENVWVGMQIIASNATNKQYVNNKMGGLYNLVFRATNLTSMTSRLNPQVTNIDFTTKALQSARLTLENEIPKQISAWKSQPHSAEDAEALINELKSLQDLILTVSEVVGCVGQTYEKFNEDANPVFNENSSLSKFTASIENEIENLQALFNQSQPSKEIKGNEKSTDVKSLGELLKKTTNFNTSLKITQPTYANLKFESQEHANKWFVQQSKVAASECKKYPDQVQTFNDFKTFSKKSIGEFEKFANGIDLAFQKNGKGNEIPGFVTDVSAKMLETGVSESLKPLLTNPKSFSYLLKAIAKEGQEADFHLFFKTLLNEQQTGPADFDKAPLVLNEILKNIAYYNLFKV